MSSDGTAAQLAGATRSAVCAGRDPGVATREQSDSSRRRTVGAWPVQRGAM